MTNKDERRIKEITYDLQRLQEINRILLENREGEYERTILLKEKELLESQKEENTRELKNLVEHLNNNTLLKEVFYEIF